MKIAIGINGYKEEESLEIREKLCLESLRKLKMKFPDTVYLYNVCREGVTYDEFTTIHMEHAEQFTMVNRLLDSLFDTETGCDVISIINNDIIVSDCLIDQLDCSVDTHMASRVNIEPINSLSDELDIVEYSVHGFDLIAVTKKWWKHNREILPDMYIGRQYWDTVYFTLLMRNSECKVLNKLPPVIFHPRHETVSGVEDEYDEFNKHAANQVPQLRYWWNYVYNVLLKRHANNNTKYWWPFKNEVELEGTFFND